jgi:hypothetical protein
VNGVSSGMNDYASLGGLAVHGPPLAARTPSDASGRDSLDDNILRFR